MKPGEAPSNSTSNQTLSKPGPNQFKSKGLNHAGDTTYETQSYPNSIMTKKTVNVKVYQNTKIDTQRHITDTNLGEDGSTALERSATHVTGGLNLVKGCPTSRVFHPHPIRHIL